MGAGWQRLCWAGILCTGLCQLSAASATAGLTEGQPSFANDTASSQQQQRRARLQELSVLEAEVEGGPGQQSSHSHYQLSVPGGECPNTFQRIEFDNIKSGHAKPYVLGGDQLPECTNCKRDEERTHFCRQESFIFHHHEVSNSHF